MLGVLLILSFVVYAVYNMLPVDKAADMAMQEIAANKNLVYAERYLYWQRRLGLDGGLLLRYFRWLGFAPFYDGSFRGLLQGNLGNSVAYAKPVISVLKDAFCCPVSSMCTCIFGSRVFLIKKPSAPDPWPRPGEAIRPSVRCRT